MTGEPDMTPQELDLLAAVLRIAGSHLEQYRRYSDAMSYDGGGFAPSSEWSPEALEDGVEQVQSIVAEERRKAEAA